MNKQTPGSCNVCPGDHRHKRTPRQKSVQLRKIPHFAAFQTTSVIFPSMMRLFESLAAMRPRALHSEYGAQTKGMRGAMTTSACSPASMNLGFSILALPVFLPIFHLIERIWHGALAVRTWMVGGNPPTCSVLPLFSFSLDALSWPGWSCTKTSAVNVSTCLGCVAASSVVTYITSPTLGSLFASLGRPLTFTPTLSPVFASWTFLWCISIVKHLPVTPVGANPTGSLGWSAPCSIRPVITSPTPLILWTPDTGIRSGFLESRFGGFTTRSRASNRLTPSMSFFFLVTFHPLHQGISFFWSSRPLAVRLTPRNPDIGMNGICFSLYPILVSIAETSVLISLYRSWLYLTLGSSILFTPTISWSIPSRWHSRACCRVWPWTSFFLWSPLAMEVSNPPCDAGTIRSATSA